MASRRTLVFWGLKHPFGRMSSICTLTYIHIRVHGFGRGPGAQSLANFKKSFCAELPLVGLYIYNVATWYCFWITLTLHESIVMYQQLTLYPSILYLLHGFHTSCLILWNRISHPGCCWHVGPDDSVWGARAVGGVDILFWAHTIWAVWDI